MESESDHKDLMQAADAFLSKLYKGGKQTRQTLYRNEAVALYGMVRYPEMRDKDICSRVNLKISTYTAIKNRLKERDMYRVVRIPDFEALGYSVISIGTGQLEANMPIDRRAKIHRELASLSDFLYFYMEGGNTFSFVAYTENYAQIKDIKDRMRDIISREGVNTELKVSSYPMSSIYVLNNFDFSHILGGAFAEELKEMGLEHELRQLSQPPAVNLKPKPKKDVVELSKFERRVFLGLIKYADLPDNRVAQKINVTRQTVARMKNKFVEKGLIVNRKIPNLKKLGMNIVAVVEAELNPDYPIEERKEGISFLQNNIPMFFWISSDMKSNFYCVFRNYNHYEEARIVAENYYRSRKYLAAEPKITLISSDILNLTKSFDALPMLERKFGMSL